MEINKAEICMDVGLNEKGFGMKRIEMDYCEAGDMRK